MTVYHAAAQTQTVTVIDRSQVGDPAPASFGLTRSVRNDYRDPDYARLAFEARRLWHELERDCGRRLLVDSGCLNLFKASVTPDLDSSYAVESYAVLEQLQLRREAFTGPQLKERFPQSKYFIPPPGSEHMFTESALPVFAYLDIGIYGHPMYEGKTPGVKIGFYNPPDVARTPSPIGSVEQFVAECVPGLREAEVVDVAVASGVDTCWYDLVADDEFILGAVPGADGLYTGVGWRGTGYKFAPWVGRVLAQLALQQSTVYEIRRFTPARFAAEGVEGAEVA
jgi:glycine/D-amino acid oxidase-like deaminating enzyme